ncbi:ATP-binding protein [Streptomyces sp. NPDC002734]|uniref:ATP-binding protein n=1 Tax=Streptomyces sp. NPDC002734 TaxID=3154426 RepID=UPI00331BB68F
MTSTAPQAALLLPDAPASVGRARRFTERSLRERSPAVSADHVDSVVLVVSELVTNAIRYGTEPGDSVRLVLDIAPGRTVVECHDPVRRRPRPRRECAERERGRGLQILEALCPRLWGTWDRPFGKAVWAALLVGLEDRPVGDVLGVHSSLCGDCRAARPCPDAHALTAAPQRLALPDVRSGALQ